MKKYLLLLLLLPTIVFADIKDINFDDNNFYRGIKEKLPTKIINDITPDIYDKQLIKDITNKLINKRSSKEVLKYSYDKDSELVIKDVYEYLKELKIKVNYINVIDYIETNDYTISKVIIETKNNNNLGLTYFLKDNKIFNIILEPNDIIEKYFNDTKEDNILFMETFNLMDNNLNNIPDIDDKNIDFDYNSVVILHTYKNNAIINTAVGFFISNGIIATSFDYINDSLNKSDIISVSNNDQTYKIVGLVDYNHHLDIALLKVDNSNTNYLEIDTNYSDVYQVGTKDGFKLSTTGGNLLDKDNLVTILPSSLNDAGAPLFNEVGKLIGMTKNSFLESPITVSIKNTYLKDIQTKLNQLTYFNINAVSLKEIKNSFYTSKLYNETKSLKTTPVNIGDIKNNIDLELIKISTRDKITTFKYNANNSKLLGTLSQTSLFTSQLIDEGFKVTKSNIKEIYSNSKYNVIILDIFNYLLVIVEEK